MHYSRFSNPQYKKAIPAFFIVFVDLWCFYGIELEETSCFNIFLINIQVSKV